MRKRSCKGCLQRRLPRILPRLEDLATSPRPRGCKKLKGVKTVDVTRVAHRREVTVSGDRNTRRGKIAGQIDLKKHGAIWEDFWDGLVSESRRKEKGIPYEQYRAKRLKPSRTRT